MRQEIFPARRIFFAGDKVTFTLHGLDPARSGRAIVRTNLGRCAVRRAEITSATEKNHSIPGLDWGDIELVKSGESASITLGLPEVGIFEAKCLFIPDDGGPIVWAEGENFFLKVESPASVCGNSMYSAFVRQFGATAEMAQSPSPDAAEKGLEERGYTVIPPSGTFRQLISRLDHIFGTLGCRILQLLPVHPLPTYFVIVMLNIASFLSNGMEQYYVFQNAFNRDWIEVLDLYVYNYATAGRGNYPLATAISILKSAVSLLLLTGANGLSKLIRGESFI